MTTLPLGWEVVALNDLQASAPRAITDGPFGSNLTSAHYTTEGPRVVRLQNIGDGHFVDNRAHISNEHFESLRAHEVRAGDLLIASLGDDPPRACLAPPALGPAIVKADCIRVRLGPFVDPRWVLYALQTPAIRHWASERMYGVGRTRLGLKTIRAIPVPLPPLSKQQQIVEVLEDRFSQLDAAQAELQRARDRCGNLLESFLQTNSLVRAAARSRVGELLAQPLANGRSVPDGDGFPVLRLTCLADGRIDFSKQKLGRWSAAEAAPHLVKQGDLLVSRGNGSLRLVGRAGLVRHTPPEPVAFPDTLIRVRARAGMIDDSYLCMLWNSVVVRQQIEDKAQTTAGIYKINQRHLEELTVPCPPLSSQKALVLEAQQLQESTSRVQDAIVLAQAREAGLRRSLLSAAFKGRLAGSRAR